MARTTPMIMVSPTPSAARTTGRRRSAVRKYTSRSNAASSAKSRSGWNIGRSCGRRGARADLLRGAEEPRRGLAYPVRLRPRADFLIVAWRSEGSNENLYPAAAIFLQLLLGTLDHAIRNLDSSRRSVLPLLALASIRPTQFPHISDALDGPSTHLLDPQAGRDAPQSDRRGQRQDRGRGSAHRRPEAPAHDAWTSRDFLRRAQGTAVLRRAGRIHDLGAGGRTGSRGRQRHPALSRRDGRDESGESCGWNDTQGIRAVDGRELRAWF